jgi:hypothetical protein
MNVETIRGSAHSPRHGDFFDGRSKVRGKHGRAGRVKEQQNSVV